MKKNAFLISLFLIVITSIVFIYFINNKINNIVMVDVIKTVNEYKFKKELESKVDIKLKDYTNQVDSLKGIYTVAVNSKDFTTANTIGEKIYNLQNDEKKVIEISNQNINEQVWKRLNPLLEDFGK